MITHRLPAHADSPSALAAHCPACGSRFRVLDVTDRATVDHVCGRGACGPLWTLHEPPLPAAAAVEAVA